MAFERKNHTQSMATEAAQQAFERLARDLRVPKSAVLQTILEAVPAADLVALVRGDLALHTAKIVALEPVICYGFLSKVAVQTLRVSRRSCWPRLCIGIRIGSSSTLVHRPRSRSQSSPANLAIHHRERRTLIHS